MTAKVGDNKLRKLAACVGIIQSVTWIVMSMICIILYYSPVISNNYSSYMELIQLTIYGYFLYTSEEVFPNQTFTGTVFNVFMWFYVLLDVLWLIVSIYLLFKNTPRALKAWSHCTLLVSLWDFITFVILGADYNKCLDYAETTFNQVVFQEVCANAILPVFIIAAKGFTLWIFNIALGVILERKSRQL